MRRGTSWKAENASAGAPNKSRSVTRQRRPRPRPRPLLMTSDRGDLRASAFPLVLAAASIGEGARRRSSIPPRSHKCNIPAQLSRRDVLQAGGPGSRSKAKSTSSPIPILFPTFSCAPMEMESSNRIKRAAPAGGARRGATGLRFSWSCPAFVTKRNSLPDGERRQASLSIWNAQNCIVLRQRRKSEAVNQVGEEE